MRRFKTFLLPLCLFCISAAVARAQVHFEPPAGTLPFDDTGTLEAAEGEVLKIRDSKNDLWMMQLAPHATTEVKGNASPDYLRVGQLVTLNAVLDKKGTVRQPVSKISILSGKDKVAMGLFTEGDSGPQAKAVRNPNAGTFVIRGKISAARDGEIVVSAGNKKYTAKLADDVEIDLESDDPQLAQTGDKVKVKAWYFENAKPMAAMNVVGKAQIEEISITLAKPLAGEAKKGRK